MQFFFIGHQKFEIISKHYTAKNVAGKKIDFIL